MSAQFSPEWWNEQAQASGGLSRDDIIALSGIDVATVWNPDNTIAVFWYKDATNRVPGLADAKLALANVSAPAGFDVRTVIGRPDYPSWAYYQSQVGFVAPGATTAWTPTFSPTAPTNFTPVVTTPTVSAIPAGWSTFGSPSWPATWNGAELFVEDLNAWRAAPVLIAEAMRAPGRAMWIDRAANRVVAELDLGDPVFPWLYVSPVPSASTTPVSVLLPPDEGYPPGGWITETGGGEVVGLGPEDQIAPAPPGAPAPSGPLPGTPDTSAGLYALAIGLGLLVLLGGRRKS